MSFIRNMKLTQKISLLTVSFFIFLVMIGAASIRQISDVNAKLIELNDARMVPIIELGDMKSSIEYIRSQGNAYMDASDESTRKTIKDDTTTRINELNSQLTKYKNDPNFKDLLKNYDSFITAKDTFIKFADEQGIGKQGVKSAQTDAGDKNAGGPPVAFAAFDKAKTALVASFDKIIKTHVAVAKKTYTDSERTYENTRIELLVLLIVCVVITLILSVVIIRSIIVPVQRVTTKLREISNSNGDLTQRIGYDSKDEIGQLSSSFDLFIEKLQGIIREVVVSAGTISESSKELNQAAAVSTQSLEQIASTVIEIASGTSDEAAAAEETTASLSEAEKFSEATSNASKNTSYNSKKAKGAAEESAVKIGDVVSSITEIAASSQEVSMMITDLNKSSGRIGDIIKIITSISEQTNLLALNAAIEAARAGEAGRGFNVVAAEIRKLADESNHAAGEIAQLVKENQLKSANAVNLVSKVDQKVSSGVTKASEIGESIRNIITNIQDVVNQIEQIENANEQQVQTTKEITKAINSIAITSNQIADGTENISASIEEQLSTMNEIEKTTEKLAGMAKKLSEMTSGFKV